MEKHEGIAVFMYLAVLLFVVVVNLIDNTSLFDLAYLFVVVCCVFKFFLIMKSEKE
ncbi:MAG: hypothetical protein ACI4WU_03275 [Bacilli bacterium]